MLCSGLVLSLVSGCGSGVVTLVRQEAIAAARQLGEGMLLV